MNTSLVKPLMEGAAMLAAWTIALFFWRFWKKTRDRLFVFFAMAFLLLGIERVGLTLAVDQTNFYLVRLCAFLLILYAIIGKNRKEGGP